MAGEHKIWKRSTKIWGFILVTLSLYYKGYLRNIPESELLIQPRKSYFVKSHTEYEYLYSSRRNLVQFACMHARKLFVDSKYYSHKVGTLLINFRTIFLKV